MPPPAYPGQIPGIGGNGPYGGDFTAGVDLGYSPWSPPLSTYQLPGDPYSYADPAHGGTGDTNVLAPGYQFAPPPEANPVVPTEPNAPGGAIDTPPATLVPTNEPIEGELIPRGQPELPAPSGGEYGPHGEVVYPWDEYTGPDRLPTPQKATRKTDDQIRRMTEDAIARVTAGALGRVIGRLAGALGGPAGIVLEEIVTPSQLDPEPDVRGWNPRQSAPPSAPSATPTTAASTAGGNASVGLPRPARPSLPTIPRTPTINVPKEPPQWPVQVSSPLPPSSTGFPSPASPSPVPANTAPSMPTSAPTSATSTQSTSPTAPWLRITPSLPVFGRPSRSPSVPTSASSSPSSPVSSTPRPISEPAPAPTSQPVAQPLPQPSAPGGIGPPQTPLATATPTSEPPSCETPQQQRQRRARQREQCERFITIKVPAHRRRVCAAEAGRIIGKRIGKALGKALVRKGLEAAGLRKAPRRTARAKERRSERPLRLTKHGVDAFGVGIELPHEINKRIRFPGGPHP